MATIKGRRTAANGRAARDEEGAEGLAFSQDRTQSAEITKEEIDDWEQWFLPPSSVPKTGLILDVGARDGDTAYFYVRHGYLNLRLVEPNKLYHEDLRKNATIMTQRWGARIEVVEAPFSAATLEGVAFAKFDCEGCEYEIDLASLPIPWAAEVHKRLKPDENGVYPYVMSIGYRRSETGKR